MTHPVAGNHEYNTPGAAGYFAYFGDAAAPQSHGYHSFDVGDWHFIAPQTPSQQLDAQRGIREFVVGTGGRSHSNFVEIQPNSEVREGKTYGVMLLKLHSNSYDWQFVPDTQEGNGKFTDKGTDTCHGTAPGTENGAGPRAIPVVTAERPGTMIARFTVDFMSTKPGQARVLFGPGPGCSGLVMTATGDQGAGTAHHVFVVTGNDLPGTVGDAGITPGTTYSYETVTLSSSGTEIDNNGGKCYSVSVPRS